MPKCRAFFNKLDEYKTSGGVPLGDIILSNTLCNSSSSSSSSSGDGSGSSSGNSESKQSALETLLTLSRVAISGATGPCAHHINGVYEPTPDSTDGFTSYKMQSQDVYLEYNSTRGHWQVKPLAHRGTTHAWMYISSGCVPPDSLSVNTSVHAHVWDGEKFVTQMAVHFSRPNDDAVLIAGCTGRVANQVNGTFEPTEETCG